MDLLNHSTTYGHTANYNSCLSNPFSSDPAYPAQKFDYIVNQSSNKKKGFSLSDKLHIFIFRVPIVHLEYHTTNQHFA